MGRLTFEELWTQTLDTLQSSANAIGVSADSIRNGRLDELPSDTPFVWLYLVPFTKLRAESSMPQRAASVVVLVGAEPVPDTAAATIQAVVIAEQCEKALSANRALGLRFDALNLRPDYAELTDKIIIELSMEATYAATT